MSRSILLLIGILGWIAITLLCLWRSVPQMEADLHHRTMGAIEKANFTFDSVSFDGRDAYLTGEVASDDIKMKLGNIVAGVYGVRVVDNQLTVKQPPKPRPEERVEKVEEPKLSEKGAALQKEFNDFFKLNRIQFANNSSRLLSTSTAVLNNAATLLGKLPGSVVEIQGHTDNTGRAERNLELSQQRAESVKQYLVKKGIAANRLVAKGYGSARPTADNNTPAGRLANRRVEFKILEEK